MGGLMKMQQSMNNKEGKRISPADFIYTCI